MSRQVRVLARALASMSMLSLLAVSGVAVGGGGVAGAAQGNGQGNKQPPASLVKKAKAQGTLTWYTSQQPTTAQDTVNAFKKKYGVSVNTVRLASGSLDTRFQSEEESGSTPADVITDATNSFFTTGVKKGWWQPVSSRSVPAYTSWPAQAKSKYTVTTEIIPICIVYNTNSVKKGTLKNWPDLLKSQFSGGKMALANPALIPPWMDEAYFWYKTYGPNFLKKLGSQDPAIVTDSTPATEAMAAGEYSVVIPNTPDNYTSFKGKGAPLGLVIPEATTGVVQQTAVVSGSKHQAAATLFMNFLMSKQGLQVADGGSSAPIPGIPGTVPLPAKYQAPQDAAAMAHAAEIEKLLGIHS